MFLYKTDDSQRMERCASPGLELRLWNMADMLASILTVPSTDICAYTLTITLDACCISLEKVLSASRMKTISLYRYLHHNVTYNISNTFRCRRSDFDHFN